MHVTAEHRGPHPKHHTYVTQRVEVSNHGTKLVLKNRIKLLVIFICIYIISTN